MNLPTRKGGEGEEAEGEVRPHGEAHPLVLYCRLEQGPLAREVLMRRREFIALIVASAAWPSTLQAQSVSKLWRIGVLDTASAELNKQNLDAFKNRLRELGYTEGQNFIMVYRSADGRNERLPALVSELIGLQPDVIVVRGTREVLTLKNATTAP